MQAVQGSWRTRAAAMLASVVFAGTAAAQIQPVVDFDPHQATISPGSTLDATLTVHLAAGDFITPFARHYGQTLISVSGSIFSGEGEEMLLGALPGGPLAAPATYTAETTFFYPSSGFYDAGAAGFVRYGFWVQPLDGSGTAPFFVTSDYPFDFLSEIEVLDSDPVAAIPEPQTYALLLAGMGLLGFAARPRLRS